MPCMARLLPTWDALQAHMTDWLDGIANQRLHGTTGQQPAAYSRDQRAETICRAYLRPSCVDATASQARMTRKADKTESDRPGNPINTQRR
ncbi:MAG: hypothetical protein MRJ52_04525 [Nitrosomonas sp.]|nr:hypothetical protein [Nitrosomonas sp.]